MDLNHAYAKFVHVVRTLNYIDLIAFADLMISLCVYTVLKFAETIFLV